MEELSGIKTSRELEAYWESLNLLTRETIDIAVHYPDAEDSEALRFLHNKNVVFVKETHTKDVGPEACIAYLKELGCFCAQGETKREALDDMLMQVGYILPLEEEVVKWIEVIEEYERLKKSLGADEVYDIVHHLQNKYVIKNNDIFS